MNPNDEFRLFDNLTDPAEQIIGAMDRGEVDPLEALQMALQFITAHVHDVTMAFCAVLHALDQGQLRAKIQSVEIRCGDGLLAFGMKVARDWNPATDATDAEREAMVVATMGVLRVGGLTVERRGQSLWFTDPNGGVHNLGDPWENAVSELREEIEDDDRMDRWLRGE